MRRASRQENIWSLAKMWGDTVAEAKRTTDHLSDEELAKWVAGQERDERNRVY